MLVAVALGVLGLGILYAFGAPSVSDRWTTWIIKAFLASGAAFGVGMLTLGLPGAFFLETILGPSPTALPPDAAWPLSIVISQIGALTILPASLLLRAIMPKAVGWAHVGATALLIFVAALVFTAVLAGTYASV